MPGYKKSIGKKRRVYRKRVYKRNTVDKLRKKSDALISHISLTDNMVLNVLASRTTNLVNWAGDDSGTDVTFRLTNSPEFTRNRARYRWYKVHSMKITARPLNIMYEFDTARTGGLTTIGMASSPVQSDCNSINVDGLF